MTNKIIWLTGNSGSGKTTLALGIKRTFDAIVLDGDDMRKTISTNEGFSMADRRKHNLRVARLADLLASQGFTIIVSVIAPFRNVRKEIDAICSPLWVYVKKKGLGANDRPYEPPEDPDIIIDNDELSIEKAKEKLTMYLHDSQ